MNRIKIDRRVYDLGKVTRARMTMAEWDEAKAHLRRNDKAHVVKVGEELFYLLEARADPKYKTVDLSYRPMALAFVEAEETTVDPDDISRLSIRALRQRGEL